ncbi:hypothetical protein [Cupriavidus taiwanensis]|uniref:Uncharacterized protein n=1 Tax=Cupriavidus taiwanensis TaxID=164546 RepID=A0A375J7C9_9BURK|nr:hypothetical protein [Cupriavidus taiwanensis]SPR99526.1 conserved hypothetical protein [Cupriavidus taiwanensis]
MSSIQTTICEAASVVIKPVNFQLHSYEGKTYWFATQTLEVTTHDGHQCSITIHLQEGLNVLMAGDPVVFPPVPASAGEPA